MSKELVVGTYIRVFPSPQVVKSDEESKFCVGYTINHQNCSVTW